MLPCYYCELFERSCLSFTELESGCELEANETRYLLYPPEGRMLFSIDNCMKTIELLQFMYWLSWASGYYNWLVKLTDWRPPWQIVVDLTSLDRQLRVSFLFRRGIHNYGENDHVTRNCPNTMKKNKDWGGFTIKRVYKETGRRKRNTKKKS